jgi:transposase
MQKISTVRRSGNKIFKTRQLTIGLDLGDRSSCYCVLDENGEIIREQKIATTPEGMQQAFGKMARSRIAMETGTHSPWVSRVLTGLGHEVIVAHAQNVRLIVKSRRKDDRLDARTRARLARIDPELLSPVQHRSAQAQLHLAEIRARAGLVSARTALVNAARGLVKWYGERLRKCGTQQVSRETTKGLSTGLREAHILLPIVEISEGSKHAQHEGKVIWAHKIPHVFLIPFDLDVRGTGICSRLRYLRGFLHSFRVTPVEGRGLS